MGCRWIRIGADTHVYWVPSEQLPEQIADLVDHMRQYRGSPGPSLDQIRQDLYLQKPEMEGLDEPKVEEYFQSIIFHDSQPGDSLERIVHLL